MNIHGSTLIKCGKSHTGFTRSGYCDSSSTSDTGRHWVCAVEGTSKKSKKAWKNFLQFTKNHTTNSDLADHIIKTGSTSWCLCEGRYNEAVRNNKAPYVDAYATNNKVHSRTKLTILRSIESLKHQVQNLRRLIV